MIIVRGPRNLSQTNQLIYLRQSRFQGSIEADNDILTAEVFDEEILEGMKQINPLKAPGPDDMQAVFYQKLEHYR